MDSDMKKRLAEELKELSPESIEKVKTFVEFLHYEKEKRESDRQKEGAMLTDDFLSDGLPESKPSFREEM